MEKVARDEERSALLSWYVEYLVRAENNTTRKSDAFPNHTTGYAADQGQLDAFVIMRYTYLSFLMENQCPQKTRAHTLH